MDLLWLWIVLGVVILLGIIIWVTYNSLVTLKMRVDEAWSDITIQLKRRLDLIPNLVNSVKGYAAHESGVFEKVTEARANALNAQSVQETAKAENQFEDTLKSLFAVAESYPDLKANQNFIQLQQELVDTEDKIQAARRFYNGGVRELNTKIQIFPNNLFAGMLGFKQREFFEIDDPAKVQEPVEVKF
ncbi:MAG TPA: LemA family protein [Candidatus Saccharimonadales bacterium]